MKSTLCGLFAILIIYFIPNVSNETVKRTKFNRDVMHAHSWGYDLDSHHHLGPLEWHVKYPHCSGAHQSPINIIKNNAIYDETLSDILLTIDEPIDSEDDKLWRVHDDGHRERLNYEKELKDSEKNISENLKDEKAVWRVSNNGHTVQLHLTNKKISTVITDENYDFLQMHFHWSESEHCIDDNYYSAELHLVHKSIKDHKIAVLGFLFQETIHDNLALEPLISKLHLIVQKGTFVEIDDFELDQLIPIKIKNYFHYDGSLTTPPCSENVNWNVAFDKIIKISKKQLQIFKTLENGNNKIIINARTIQNLNQRDIRKSWDDIDQLYVEKVLVGYNGFRCNQMSFWLVQFIVIFCAFIN